MSESVASEIVAVCRAVLEDPAISLESTTATVESWDSLGHLNLIAAIESQFNVELDVMEMAEVDSVASLIAVVERTLHGARVQLRSGS